LLLKSAAGTNSKDRLDTDVSAAGGEPPPRALSGHAVTDLISADIGTRAGQLPEAPLIARAAPRPFW
jgi:hypothetical protein